MACARALQVLNSSEFDFNSPLIASKFAFLSLEGKEDEPEVVVKSCSGK